MLYFVFYLFVYYSSWLSHTATVVFNRRETRFQANQRCNNFLFFLIC